MTTPEGSTKKFLYNGPQKSRDQEDNKEWKFTYNKKKPSNIDPVDFDNVWSIKKNVGVSKSSSTCNSDKLNLNADTKFYSRHNSLQGCSQHKVINGNSEGGKLLTSDSSNSFINQRRGSNTRRHSLTTEDNFDF